MKDVRTKGIQWSSVTFALVLFFCPCVCIAATFAIYVGPILRISGNYKWLLFSFGLDKRFSQTLLS